MNKIAFTGAANDFAVRAQGLHKVYRLYRKPSYRVRDMFGLLPNNTRYFSEHIALHDVTLSVRRGEKVAIIGRNGAGKSTLLKLITRVIQPTAGTISLNGKTQALLSLGTGFHPELTGRENVLAYLANFGIAGEKAASMIDEIIDFAELEEYIDQPTKTYSSGMNMRLMFSVSTMFVPDLLVIDEVLGVGDAYFQGKSFERIREICSGQGTTLLLVTHDIHTASTLCERMIWIDQGAVLLDADSATVLKAYDTSIRQQEESRLRKKALLGAQRMAEMSRQTDVPMLIELRSPDNTPLPSPVAVSRISLFDGEREWRAALGNEGATDTTSGRPIQAGGSWGEVVTWQGRQARQMKHYGSPIHKVGISFLLPASVAGRFDQMRLEIELGCEHECQLEAWRIDANMLAQRVGAATTVPGEWIMLCKTLSGDTGSVTEKSAQLPIVGELVSLQLSQTTPNSEVEESTPQSAPETNTEKAGAQESHGSGRVIITSIRLYDGNDQETLQIEHGKPCTVLLGYQINDATLKEHCQIVLAFRRNGIDDMFRLFGKELMFDAASAPQGEIVLRLERMPLGAAEYSVTVLVAAENYYEERPTMYFAINPKVYWAARNLIDIRIVSDHLIPTGTGVVGEANWSLR
jgi:ABC-type polysaccharide/polyol phosphate transport system ATPase subunit